MLYMFAFTLHSITAHIVLAVMAFASVCSYKSKYTLSKEYAVVWSKQMCKEKECIQGILLLVCIYRVSQKQKSTIYLFRDRVKE